VTGTRIERPGAALECSLVPWDSATFGFPVAQVDRFELDDGAEASGLLDAFDAWCGEHDVRLVSARLDHRKLRESMALEAHGFRFIETVYMPRRETFERIDTPRHALAVTDAAPADLEALATIGHDAFTTGRFLLDQRLPPELSKRRYAEWVRTSVETPGQHILKAEADGELVGFFIVERRPDRSVYWHLTAVAPAWQGRGIGLSLWQTMLRRHEAEGTAFVETTISGHNLPAINLYARLGFSFAASQMTFHWLRVPPSTADPAR
jgi:ribosomal protein S18 acetylase RimI-like enzyme